MNQKINGQILSPLESLQVSYNFVCQKKMNELIGTGEMFGKEDYQRGAEQIIPVLAGASYQKMFKAGDTFQGKYLGEKDLKFQIRGFLKRMQAFHWTMKKYCWTGCLSFRLSV